MARDCPSSSPALIIHIGYSVNNMPSSLFLVFYAHLCQKNLKPRRNSIRAPVGLDRHVTARHGREAKGAKRVNVQYLLVLL